MRISETTLPSSALKTYWRGDLKQKPVLYTLPSDVITPTLFHLLLIRAKKNV